MSLVANQILPLIFLVPVSMEDNCFALCSLHPKFERRRREVFDGARRCSLHVDRNAVDDINTSRVHGHQLMVMGELFWLYNEKGRTSYLDNNGLMR